MLRHSAKPSNNGLRSHVSVWTTARGLLTSSPSPASCPARSSSSLPNTWLIDRMHHVCQVKEEEQDTSIMKIILVLPGRPFLITPAGRPATSIRAAAAGWEIKMVGNEQQMFSARNGYIYLLTTRPSVPSEPVLVVSMAPGCRLSTASAIAADPWRGDGSRTRGMQAVAADMAVTCVVCLCVRTLQWRRRQAEQLDNGKACGYVYVVMVLLVATAGRLNTRGASAGERRENANRCVCVWTQQVWTPVAGGPPAVAAWARTRCGWAHLHVRLWRRSVGGDGVWTRRLSWVIGRVRACDFTRFGLDRKHARLGTMHALVLFAASGPNIRWQWNGGE